MTRNLKSALFSALLVWAVAYPVLGLKLTIVGINLEVHNTSPAILATDDWNLPLARQNLETVLQKTRGCSVEVIMKDVSTVRNQPQRLWDWAKMAMEVVGQYA